MIMCFVPEHGLRAKARTPSLDSRENFVLGKLKWPKVFEVRIEIFETAESFDRAGAEMLKWRGVLARIATLIV
jgi:hypothetical protein